ncbi:MAG: hypothetical protein EOS73_03775 [Mesorhizobium sp.]|uniref:hypothetical protein n=1 Tax=Mesorhizobium sp. M7A.F.Ca.ET.027.02.1.1 TaxID=2496655 RepID=UPI000FD4A3FA|nr:hypothetical protein [Mesorhizobium sp. M7A.F.Ca.ET.027.02.1.1]RVD15745.1 hypothetical protein EN749_14855 [Mesorhizobium sp. M7A.F.Ca.ET.027.02.1.1]RWD12873.1 MAG: hypothetical protein EOS73_03775 [Mesorhizobium sp.]
MGTDDDHRPERSAKELVWAALDGFRPGDIAAVKAVLAMVRDEGPHLTETDDELTELIVTAASAKELFVEFNLHQ